MVAGESTSRSGTDGVGGNDPERFRESETPTPAIGLPLGEQPPPTDRLSTTDQFPVTGSASAADRPEPAGADDVTPAHGIEGLSEAVAAEDFGQAGPAVFGADGSATAAADAPDWPKLEYRSRSKPERGGGGAFDFLRRRRG